MSWSSIALWYVGIGLFCIFPSTVSMLLSEIRSRKVLRRATFDPGPAQYAYILVGGLVAALIWPGIVFGVFKKQWDKRNGK